jgi:hypothetical protein
MTWSSRLERVQQNIEPDPATRKKKGTDYRKNRRITG